MKRKYFKSLVWATIVFGLNFQTHAQDKKEVAQIRSNYDLAKLQQISTNFKKIAKTEKEQALRIAKQKGWKTKFTTQKGNLVELQRVVDGKPIYYTTFNVDAAKSTRTNHLNTGGSLGLNLMGEGMTAHVWDGGLARGTHQEYDGAGGNNRFSIGDGTTSLHYHSAHVTGTIMASGVVANAKGMAPHAKAVGYDWNNDMTEAIGAAANGMLISNHSYGYATRNSNGQVQLPQYYFGGYIGESKQWDEVLFNAPNYLMVVAAGNDGYDNSANTNPSGGYGFDKLTGHATAKNNLVVANALDANVDANGNLVSVTINGSSSEGPTDDFRIKPDITGNGTGVYSTYASSDTAYNSITGTSMASPNVAGSLLLLQEHYKNLNGGTFMKAATLKGLALHTADDAGVPGPDAVFGWGLLHAKRAAEAITNKGTASKIEELTLTSGQTYTITVESDGTNPLLASISWTDRSGVAVTTVNSTTPVLVNDLDLRVSKSGTTFLPYELTGATTNAKRDNNVDPFERVDVANASGTYTITVTHKGSLTGGSQNYSLIVTGITGTPVVCNATVPTGVSTTGITASGATVNWSEVAGATYDVRYKAVSTSSWTTSTESTTTKLLSGLSASTEYEVQVRSKCASGNSSYSASTNFTTLANTVNYCASKGNSVVDEYIQKVVLGTISNTSTGGNGYSDHTAVTTDLIKGESNTITITPKWVGTVYNEAYAVFIDYNQDGDFNDVGETVWTKSASKTTPVSGSFTVPSSATNGPTRMRVAMKYNGIPTPCETFSYGEVEDYTVVIVEKLADIIAPTAPSNLIASNITQTTLTISWTASTDNVGVTEYDVYQGTTKIGATADTTINVTGLTPATDYVFTAYAKDAAGNISKQSYRLNVTTLSNQVSYCNSKGNRVTYEWIDYVAFGGMTNTSGANGGYGDFTSKVANVSLGSTNQLVLRAGFSGATYNEYFTVWIDYNRDGDFNDAGEQVVTGNSSSAVNRITDVVIPSNVILGHTRMRVSMKYNSAPTSCEANLGDGEVEDYTVNITQTPVVAITNAVMGETIKNRENLDLVAYPNPSVDYIQVKLASKSAKMTYKIVNVIGSTVQSGHIGNSKIDVSKLNTGMYILKVYDGQKELTTKLLKNQEN